MPSDRTLAEGAIKKLRRAKKKCSRDCAKFGTRVVNKTKDAHGSKDNYTLGAASSWHRGLAKPCRGLANFEQCTPIVTGEDSPFPEKREQSANGNP